MAIFNDFPYSDLHNENLDWVINQLKKLNAFIENNPNLDPSGFEEELEEIRNNITALENSISTTNDNVDAVKESITQIEKNIESINTKIDTINSSLQTTNSAITGLTAEITSVKKSMPNVGFYNTSYVVYVGDSYTAGPGSTDGRGWPDRLTSILPVGTRTYTVWNGGGGFTRAGDGGTMTQAVQNANIPDKDQVSLVICMAGINDDDSSDVYTGVGNFITACRSLFPNARYIISGSAAPYIQSLKKYNSIAQSAIVRQASESIQRITGVDLMSYLIQKADQIQLRIFLYGAKEEVNVQMQKKLKETYPNICIAGYQLLLFVIIQGILFCPWHTLK